MSAGSMTGNVFIIFAPSGAGKSTLVNALLLKDRQLHLSVSYTTRSPRPGVVHGREYYFIRLEELSAGCARGVSIESAEVNGHYYASSRLWIEEQLRRGQDIV